MKKLLFLVFVLAVSATLELSAQIFVGGGINYNTAALIEQLDQLQLKKENHSISISVLKLGTFCRIISQLD
jgi:hypothetical protein